MGLNEDTKLMMKKLDFLNIFNNEANKLADKYDLKTLELMAKEQGVEYAGKNKKEIATLLLGGEK
jgi:hypothetical protein